MNIVGAVLTNASLYFAELEDYQTQTSESKGHDRLVSVDGELNVICERLRQPRAGKQTEAHHFHRIRPIL